MTAPQAAPELSTASRPEAVSEMPTLPKSLLNLIGEYGMARTDRASELEIQHRWLLLIAGIKDYALSARAALGQEPLTLLQIQHIACGLFSSCGHDDLRLARTIEAAHGIVALPVKGGE